MTRTLLVRIAVLTVLYVLTARLGLGLDAVGGFAALVWAPSGIALAAVLLFGREVWPAIAIGALAANTWAGAPFPVALAIAAGNTAEALVASWALHRVPGFRAQMDRVADVLALLGLGASLSTLISATVGVTSLVLGGVIPATDAPLAFRAWWLGDLIGIVLVVPVVLAWHAKPRLVRNRRRLAEIGVLTLAMAGVGAVTFLRVTPLATGAIMPVLIWAALRFGPRGAATASFVVAAMAIWATAAGSGPFVRPRLQDSLFALQLFLGIVTTTFLVLSASFSERRRAERDARRAEAEASQANTAKADFLAVMSHELRTPLNAISGYVDLMTDEVQGPLTPQQRDSLGRIQRNGRHLLTLIEDVLAFAKFEAGRTVIDTCAVGADDVIDSVEPLVLPQLQKKRLRLVRQPRNRDLVVRTDPEKLRQILVNVLSNAVKYTPEEGQISIGAARRGTMVKIWVTDTGAGIPSDQLPRVFEPFFQVDRGTTRKYPGIGLGLTITRDLARAMGGDVLLESTEGTGTTVHILLPATERRRSGNASSPASAATENGEEAAKERRLRRSR